MSASDNSSGVYIGCVLDNSSGVYIGCVLDNSSGVYIGCVLDNSSGVYIGCVLLYLIGYPYQDYQPNTHNWSHHKINN